MATPAQGQRFQPDHSPPPAGSGPAMVIVALVLILAGSFTGMIILWLQDAPLWQIALGYVGGGWAGLLGGMAVGGLAGLVQSRRSKSGQRIGMKPRHPAGGDRA